MQNAIQSLNFNQNSIRSFIDEKGEMWFLANDVCQVLDYVNPRRTVSLHCKEKGVTKRYTPTESGNQEMTFINEPNLYRLIIKSRKPEAEQFEEWVMETVLPQIRKTGSYQNSGSLKTQTALPNGLTLEQQDEIKKFHRELVQAAPKEQQAKLAITLWSSIKSKFGVSYKNVPSEHYPEVLSLMARVAVEKTVLHGEVLDKEISGSLKAALPQDYFIHLAKMVSYAAEWSKIQRLMCHNPHSEKAREIMNLLNWSSSGNQSGYLFIFKPDTENDINQAIHFLHQQSQVM